MDEIEVGPWRPGLTDDEAAQARALLKRVAVADGRVPAGLPEGDARVLPGTVDGALVGLAWRSGDDPAELYVDPPYRGRGHGRRMAEVVLASGGVWAHGTLPAARAVAARLGARPIRRLLQLRRPLTGPMEVDVPEGVRIRTFRPGADEAAFLTVNARAFAWHPEQGRLDAAGLAAEMAQDWFDADGFFLAVTDSEGAAGDETSGRVLGFHWTKVHRVDPTPPPAGRHAIGAGDPGPIGEVYVLGVDPDSPIRRLGGPLTAAGLNYLAGRRLDTVMLYVEDDNEPALRLYRRMGFSDYAVDTVFAR